MKKRTITYIIVILIMLVIAIGVFITKKHKENAEELKTIKVNEVTRSVFYAPQYIAINNGYFKEKGLNIELTTGQGADAVMTAVLSNQSDIGFAGPEASIYVYNEGKEDYIENTNQIIETKVKTGEVNVIDCYEIMEFNNNMENILKNHEKIINTSGERTVEESFEGFNKKEAI